MLNKIYNILNKLFWRPCYNHKDLVKLYHKQLKPFENYIPHFSDDDINKSYREDNAKWYHSEYVYLIKNGCVLEPTNSFCIKGFRTLISESNSNNYERPSLFRYLKHKLSLKKNTHLKKAVLIDGTLGANYFHFFSDVLNKMWMLEKLNYYQDVPFVISKNTFEKSYFQFFYTKPGFSNKKWVVQNAKSWLSIDSLVIPKGLPHHKPYWQKSIFSARITLQKSEKRIFLSRSVKAGRNLNNMHEIAPVLNKYGFDVIDTGAFSFEEQVEAFSKAECVIGIHGAGNTNIIFSNLSKVRFLEIMPANRISCHFYWLSITLGNHYDVIKGSKLDEKKSYELCPKLLEEHILKILNNQ